MIILANSGARGKEVKVSDEVYLMMNTIIIS